MSEGGVRPARKYRYVQTVRRGLDPVERSRRPNAMPSAYIYMLRYADLHAYRITSQEFLKQKYM